jgi:hypothetical protein
MDPVRDRLAVLVGRDVCVGLADGTQLDDCQLVSSSRRVATVWIVHRGDDVFVPIDAIAEVWEAGRAIRPASRRAA